MSDALWRSERVLLYVNNRLILIVLALRERVSMRSLLRFELAYVVIVFVGFSVAWVCVFQHPLL